MRQSVASSNVLVWELPYPGYLTYLRGKFQIQYLVRVLLDGYSTSTVHDLLTAQLLKTPCMPDTLGIQSGTCHQSSPARNPVR